MDTLKYNTVQKIVYNHVMSPRNPIKNIKKLLNYIL